MKSRFLVQLGMGALAATMATASFGSSEFLKLNPTTSIRYIENYGTYAVVHYNKAVDDTEACDPNQTEWPDPKGDTAKVQAAVIGYATAEDKAKFVQILAAAAARKKTHLVVNGCDTGAIDNTGLPIVERVETRF